MGMPGSMWGKVPTTRGVVAVLCFVFVCIFAFCGALRAAESALSFHSEGWETLLFGNPAQEPRDVIVPSFDGSLGALTRVTVYITYQAVGGPVSLEDGITCAYVDLAVTAWMAPLLTGLPTDRVLTLSVGGYAEPDSNGDIIPVGIDEDQDGVVDYYLPLSVSGLFDVAIASGTLGSNLERFTCQPGGIHLYRPSISVTGYASLFPVTGYTDDIAVGVGGGEHWNATITYYYGPGPYIEVPVNNATRQSRYCAVEGTGGAGKTVQILIDGAALYETQVDTENHWEKVIYLGAGAHEIRAQYEGDDSTRSDPVHTTYTGAVNSTVYDSIIGKLRKADIMFTSGGSEDFIYGPQYSHVFLYLGGLPDGTPVIGEADTPHGVVIVPLEDSNAARHGNAVSLFRPNHALTLAQRQNVVDFVKSHQRPYWDLLGDFKWITLAAIFYSDLSPVWDRLQWCTDKCDALKWSSDKFICSTLVWRAYLEGTRNGTGIADPNFDFSDPNNADLTRGLVAPVLLKSFFFDSKAFNDLMKEHYVFPDTVRKCGNISPVN